ncbi:hypothetical protein C1645_811493 [Glomus cerebriforme]|uniref:Uncharacterized protein n=1 Tax=Glomus cerebriforme TaxID=658196 RepID=A0A397TNB5_9GLOM|nr:hypothetical protein C1645_811493 [Glomus cerebriforme]
MDLDISDVEEFQFELVNPEFEQLFLVVKDMTKKLLKIKNTQVYHIPDVIKVKLKGKDRDNEIQVEILESSSINPIYKENEFILSIELEERKLELLEHQSSSKAQKGSGIGSTKSATKNELGFNFIFQ